MCWYVASPADPATGGDGQEYLQLVRDTAGRLAGPIHLLISDVVMPRISGPELARRLATLRSATRVLYLSGYSDDAVVQHCIENPLAACGFAGTIAKPQAAKSFLLQFLTSCPPDWDAEAAIR
ncbi:MAG TPA: response regulator [Gemmataceae bacterium]|nr:response regulator [Gemmataceae bacterium]